MKTYSVIWSDFAQRQLDEIYDYYFFKASPKVAKNLIRSILSAPDKLKNNIHLGPVEENLKHSGKEYRYIVHKNYKVIYRVEEQDYLIMILDVFDCRLDPQKINRNA
ncbi:type II toxin-antitoxin system RelE/ParE family toxin [Shivajiella indica]|uniref:Type II toxin-antitoxin system RelE/ParE family toxin n=1 Tax=Shivajiella indica TaxID=872115 RepID=A0ABW5B830_9BACT